MQRSLRLVFGGSAGEAITIIYPFADPDAPATQVRGLMQAIIANGEIFVNEPQTIRGAEFVIREVREITI